MKYQNRQTLKTIDLFYLGHFLWHVVFHICHVGQKDGSAVILGWSVSVIAWFPVHVVQAVRELGAVFGELGVTRCLVDDIGTEQVPHAPCNEIKYTCNTVYRKIFTPVFILPLSFLLSAGEFKIRWNFSKNLS